MIIDQVIPGECFCLGQVKMVPNVQSTYLINNILNGASCMDMDVFTHLDCLHEVGGTQKTQSDTL